jgi:Rieske Fe-S protein
LSSGKKKTLLATGFAAYGLVYGTVAALVIFDQIMGDENPYSKTYDASRITLFASAKEYIKQTVTVATQYLKDIPGIVEAKDADEIPVGDGRVIQSGAEKIAAYRDEENNLHLCSAVCTHMDCIVDFNKEEKSWDCPCHGSRFSFDGKVIEGPAIFDLPKRNLKKD